LTIDFDIYTETTLSIYTVALIKFVDEPGSINYCLCRPTVLVSCTLMYSFVVKRYVGYIRFW